MNSFAAIFSKGKRLEAFQNMGVETEGAGGKVRSPKEIIMDALVKAQEKNGGKLGKGFDKNLGTMFADVSSRRAVGAFESKFRDAGGGEAGVRAARDEFERLERAMVADEEVMESFNRAMRTSNSQAEVFNNQIRKSALQMQTDLAPAMAALAAALVPAVQELGHWVTFLTGDKQASTISSLANEDVDAAIASTKKMTEGGKISDAQLESNRVAANEARENKDRAAAELLSAKETQSEHAKSFWGRAFGVNEEGDKGNVAEKEAKLKDANALYDKMITTNEDVKRRLDGKLLVQIANVDELRAATGAPANGADGRQPGPEGKPR